MIRSIVNRALGTSESAHLTEAQETTGSNAVTEVAAHALQQTPPEPRVSLQAAQAEERPPSPTGNPPVITLELTPKEKEYVQGATAYLRAYQPKLKNVKKDIDQAVFSVGGGECPKRIPRYLMITSRLVEMFFEHHPLSSDTELRQFDQLQPLLTKVLGCRIFVDVYGQKLFLADESASMLKVRRDKAISAAYCLVSGLENSPTRVRANSFEQAALPLAKNLLRALSEKSTEAYLTEVATGDYTPVDLAYFKRFIDDHQSFVSLFHRQIGNSLPVLSSTLDLVEDEIVEMDKEVFTQLQRIVAVLLKQAVTIADHSREAADFRREMEGYFAGGGAPLVDSDEQRALFLGFLIRVEASLTNFSRDTGKELNDIIHDFIDLMRVLESKNLSRENLDAFKGLLGNLKIMPTLSSQSSKELILYTQGNHSVTRWDDMIKGPLAALYQDKVDQSAQHAEELLAAESSSKKRSIKPPPLKIDDEQLRVVKPFLSPSNVKFNRQIAVDRLARLSNLIGKEDEDFFAWEQQMQSSMAMPSTESASATSGKLTDGAQSDLKHLMTLHEKGNRLSLKKDVAAAAEDSPTSIEGLTELTRMLTLYRAGSRL